VLLEYLKVIRRHKFAIVLDQKGIRRVARARDQIDPVTFCVSAISYAETKRKSVSQAGSHAITGATRISLSEKIYNRRHIRDCTNFTDLANIVGRLTGRLSDDFV